MSAQVRSAVVRFFRANPDEALSREDLCAKFDIDERAVDELLLPELQAGRLAFGHSGDCRGAVFHAGRPLPLTQLSYRNEPAAQESLRLATAYFNNMTRGRRCTGTKTSSG